MDGTNEKKMRLFVHSAQVNSCCGGKPEGKYEGIYTVLKAWIERSPADDRLPE
jgi:hypothetical protein